MSRLKYNLLANFSGQGWAALMQFAFVPLYIRFLGIEAYGLISFYLMLNTLLQVLDFGLSQTLNRELARYRACPEKSQEARDLVRTLEVGYWFMGLLIGASIMASASLIANHWIKADMLPVSLIERIVMIMGVLVALQWPISFYDGGLNGLERHLLRNVVKITIVSINGLGAVAILGWVSPTLTAFFFWQIFVNALYVVVITFCLWRSLPKAGTPRLCLRLVGPVWRFALGMSGITFSALILTQLDKILLIRFLGLKAFGYYTLAGLLGNSLLMIITPIFNTLFPRFTTLAAAGDEVSLKQLYHRGSQLMAALILPMAALLSLFSMDILWLWTRNVETTQNTATLLSILVIGTAINGLMNLPYALQLAYGWVNISLRINALLIILLVPAIFFMSTQFGAIGAASVWVALNALYMMIGLFWTHRRLLQGELSQWFMEDVGLPLASTLVVIGIARWLLYNTLSPAVMIAYLGGTWMCAVLAAVLAAPQLRRGFLDWAIKAGARAG